MADAVADLPGNVRSCLSDFTEAAKQSCGSNLVSVVLFGSAAEGRLRTSSDVNVILVLRTFRVEEIDPVRESLRLGHAAVRLSVMFLLESEIGAAAEAFAVKFSDILDRHRILYGSDPFASLRVSRGATIQRLNQVLVNLMLRLRERYALISLREEKLVPVIADASGPIRAAAATILKLHGKPAAHPKEALEEVAAGISPGNWTSLLANLSLAREGRDMAPGAASATLLGMLDLLQGMRTLVQGLK